MNILNIINIVIFDLYWYIGGLAFIIGLIPYSFFIYSMIKEDELSVDDVSEWLVIALLYILFLFIIVIFWPLLIYAYLIYKLIMLREHINYRKEYS